MDRSNVRIDSAPYHRLPKLNAGGCIAMVKAMLAALPKDAPTSVRHAAKAVRANAVALQAARQAGRELTNEAPARTTREVDNEADALHGAIHRRLTDHELLAGHAPEVAAQAAALKKALYPEGTAFLRANTFTQWEETETWVKALSTGDRDAALRALVGGGFVDALLRVHAEYGEVIGTTKPRAAPAKVRRGGPKRSQLEPASDRRGDRGRHAAQP